jgi:hypothetical protein
MKILPFIFLHHDAPHAHTQNTKPQHKPTHAPTHTTTHTTHNNHSHTHTNLSTSTLLSSLLLLFFFSPSASKKMANKIFVGNLPFSTTAGDLETLFVSYGEVQGK